MKKTPTVLPPEERDFRKVDELAAPFVTLYEYARSCPTVPNGAVEWLTASRDHRGPRRRRGWDDSRVSEKSRWRQLTSQIGIDEFGCPRQATSVAQTTRLDAVKTILLADDSEVCRQATKSVLAGFGYTVDAVQNAQEALALFHSQIHDLVITENMMPQMSGVEMAHIIKLRSPFTPVMMYTESPPTNRSGLDLVLEKPGSPAALQEAVQQLLSKDDPSPG